MAITLNTQGNCTDDTRGTGLGDCVKLYGDLNGIDLYPKGYSVDTTTGSLPTEATYKTQIQDGDVYPLNDLFTFEQNTPDNETSTGSTGKLAEIRAGKPLYSITWNKGGCFQKSLYDKRGQNRWDIALKFETGVLFATNVSETELKAFNTGMFSPATFKFLQGTDPEMSTVVFQFNTAVELNQRSVFHTWDSLGFDMNNVEGVINVDASFETVPTALTTVNVTVVDDCNRSVQVVDLEVTDFALGGVQATTTSIDTAVYNVGGYYVLTFDAALESADTLQITIAESGSESAESTSGDLYKGQTPLVTIA